MLDLLLSSFFCDASMNIPDICHLDHLYIGGEKLVMLRNFKFQYMTDVEKSDISPYCQIWRNFTFLHMTDVEKSDISPHCQIWRNFTFLHMTDVQKYEIYPVFCCKICFVAICAVFMKSVLALLTHFCVENN